jgi:hypothetical protein
VCPRASSRLRSLSSVRLWGADADSRLARRYWRSRADDGRAAEDDQTREDTTGSPSHNAIHVRARGCAANGQPAQHKPARRDAELGRSRARTPGDEADNGAIRAGCHSTMITFMYKLNLFHWHKVFCKRPIRALRLFVTEQRNRAGTLGCLPSDFSFHYVCCSVSVACSPRVPGRVALPAQSGVRFAAGLVLWSDPRSWAGPTDALASIVPSHATGATQRSISDHTSHLAEARELTSVAPHDGVVPVSLRCRFRSQRSPPSRARQQQRSEIHRPASGG